MKARLTPQVVTLIGPDESVELVLTGGYGGVREFFVVTPLRFIVARQLGTRLFAVAFYRERELWMELRPNPGGTDLLLCSSDTMERVRNLDRSEIEIARSYFELEPGDFEDVQPDPDRMYEIFKGCRGSTTGECRQTPLHKLFLVLSCLLFGLLAMECGMLAGPPFIEGGDTAWLALSLSAAACAVLVGSSLQLAGFLAIGFPALMHGMNRAAPGIEWNPTAGQALPVVAAAVALWCLASLVQARTRRIGPGPLLQPSIRALALSCFVLSAMLVLVFSRRMALCPANVCRFSRNVLFPVSSCKGADWLREEENVVFHDNDRALVASLSRGRRGDWEIWSFGESAGRPVRPLRNDVSSLRSGCGHGTAQPSDSSRGATVFSDGNTTFHSSEPVTSVFRDGRIYFGTGSGMACFSLEKGQTAWRVDFPRVPSSCSNGSMNLAIDVPAGGDTVAALYWPKLDEWRRKTGTGTGCRPPAASVIVADRSTGRILWRTTIPLSWPGLPPRRPRLLAGVSDLLLVHVPASELYCFRRRDGRELWRRRWEAGAHDPVCADPVVAYQQGGSSISALSLSQGGRIWSVRIPGAPLWKPVPCDGGVIALACVSGTKDRIIRFLDREDGRSLANIAVAPDLPENLDFSFVSDGLLTWPHGIWRFERNSPPWKFVHTASTITAGPVQADGRIYIGTSGGMILALDLSNGTIAWRYRLRGPVARNGLLRAARGPVALSRNGILYAFNR